MRKFKQYQILIQCKKKKILDMIDKLLENRSRIQSFDCKLYYESGIQDVIGILFREKKVIKLGHYCNECY